MTAENPSPLQIAREFVKQYYTVLKCAPGLLHTFYCKNSTYVHGEQDSHEKPEEVVGGQEKIHRKLLSHSFSDCHVKILHVDAQTTLSDGIVVQVMGLLSSNKQEMRRFVQTFVLVRQGPRNFYLHNNIFRYQDEVSEGCMTEPQEQSKQEADEPEVKLEEPVSEPHVEKPEATAKEAAPETTQKNPSPAPANPKPAVSVSVQPASGQPVTAAPAFEGAFPELAAPAPAGEVGKEAATALGQETAAPKGAAPAAPPTPAPAVAALVTRDPVPTGASPGDQDSGSSLPVHPATAAPVPAVQKDNQPVSWTSVICKNLGPMSGIPPRPASKAEPQIPPQKLQQNKEAGVKPTPRGASTPIPDTREKGHREPRRAVRHPDSHQLFLGNLPHNVDMPELQALFQPFGPVLQLRIHSGGDLPNFGFVVFDGPAPVQKVLSKRPIMLRGAVRLNVEEKKPREAREGDRRDNLLRSSGIPHGEQVSGHRGPPRGHLVQKTNLEANKGLSSVQ